MTEESMNVNTANPSLEDLIIKTEVDVKSLYQAAMLPSLVARLKAVFVDLAIMLTVFTSTSLFIDQIGDISEFGKGFIFIFMFCLYDPILTSGTGSTLGHKLTGLKVRQYEHPDKKIGLWPAFLRFFLKGILGWISFLTVTGTRHKRAIHDLASGSIVLLSKDS